MLSEQDQVFRTKLIAMLTELNRGESSNAELRKRVGAYGRRLFTDAGTRTWVELKTNIKGAPYDSLLKLIQTQGATAQQSGDANAARAWEILGLSVISRTRKQADILPGIGFLDRYIEECCGYAKKAGVMVITPKAKAH